MTPEPSNVLMSLLLVAVPMLFLLGAAHSRRQALTTQPRVPVCHLSSAVPLAGLAIVAGLSLWQWLAPVTPLAGLSGNPLTLTLLTLVLLLALVILPFSQRYMAGDRRADHYARWLQRTLAAVTLVLISDHLLLFWVGWVMISLSLHKLLMTYPERPRAALGAHKKFLLARLAEISLLAAFVLLYQAHGTAVISQLVATAQTAPLDVSSQIALGLIALTALIKCAQLPVHGWLIQVTEAPTPVSALLHAGVINLGGYLLLVFGPLLALADPARWLLLGVAGLTTLLAALIMTTRISVKVRLAWSTSAQMGLMLVECALGLYELALLHLIAHSFYKAHAFLAAGSAVQQHLLRHFLPAPRTGFRQWALATLWIVPAVTLAALTVTPAGPFSPWLLLSLALIVLLARHGGIGWMPWAMLSLALLMAYSLLKLGAGQLLPESVTLVDPLADAWVAILVLALFGLHAWLTRSDSALARRVNLHLYAGLYLDEWFTRTTLRLWPVRLPPSLNAKRTESPAPLHLTQEY